MLRRIFPCLLWVLFVLGSDEAAALTSARVDRPKHWGATKARAPQSGILDTISTPCTGLHVRSDGNAGNDAVDSDSGQVQLNFIGSLECEISRKTEIYLFGISPLVGYLSGPDSILNYSLWAEGTLPLHSFLDVASGTATEPTQVLADYEYYKSGTFVTRDSTVGMDIDWYAPTDTSSCRFVIQHIRYYSFDDQTHSNLKLGVLCDWDIPSDSLVDNRAFWLPERKSMQVRGVDYSSGPFECAENSERFAASVYLGRKSIGSPVLDTTTLPFSVHSVHWRDYFHPQFHLSRALMWPLITTSSYTVNNDSLDQMAVFTIGPSLTLGLDDTLHVYMAHCVGIYTDSATFVQDIDAAKAWFVEHVIGPYVAGDADGSGIVTISDAVFLISYIFGGGGAPDPLESGDANCDGLITISDAVYLISYIFGGGPAPCP